jgi:hypothetical protein
VGNSGFVSASEDRGYFRGPHGMLKGETDCRPGSACSTPTNGIHDHEHGTALRSKKSIHVFRGPCFFYTVLSEIAPHRSDKFFGIGHDLILHGPFGKVAPFPANGANSPITAPLGR